jgi:hypothetical protein
MESLVDITISNQIVCVMLIYSSVDSHFSARYAQIIISVGEWKKSFLRDMLIHH